MTALIAGADSAIGRAVAVSFAREGADVAVGFPGSRGDAQATRRQVEAEGRRCLLLQGDVQDAAWCQRAVRNTVDAFGRLDVLVNNAALLHGDGDIGGPGDAPMQDTLDAHIDGVLRMARAALPHMQAGASIINTGCVAPARGRRPRAGHAGRPGGLHALTEALAAHLSERGIRVHAVAAQPAWPPEDHGADAPARLGTGNAAGRAAQTQALSEACVFLASPRWAGYITGLVLPVATGSATAI